MQVQLWYRRAPNLVMLLECLVSKAFELYMHSKFMLGVLFIELHSIVSIYEPTRGNFEDTHQFYHI